MLKLTLASLVLAVLFTAGFLLAQMQPPNDVPASQPAVTSHTSEMIVKDLKEVPAYLYGSDTTTLKNLPQTLKKIWEPLTTQAKGAGVAIAGAPIFVYHGVTGAPDQQFTLEAGLPVAAGTKQFGDFKVKPLAAFHCGSVYYTGPVQGIGPASAKLYQDLIAAGHIPTDEMREVYFYWEGPDSPNDVIEVQVGISQ